MYSPSVANKDMTMFLKIEFVKSMSGERGPVWSLMTLSTPLKAKKNAAICMFRMHALRKLFPNSVIAACVPSYIR